MVELLKKYVPHSLGTRLFIEMVYSIMKPFRDLLLSPEEAVSDVAKGLTMLRLWKKYLMLNQHPVKAKSGAKTDPKRRGWFLTDMTYNSLEIQCHAVIDYQLALFLHAPTKGQCFASPYNASTICTERFISQNQANTTQFQSTIQEPSFAQTLDRASKILFNISTMKELAENNIKIRSQDCRKKNCK